MPTDYYRVDGGRLTLAEYWRMSPNALVFLIAAAARPFGGLLNVTVPRVDRLHVADWTHLPGSVRDALRGPVDRLAAAGFAYQFCHRLPNLEADRTAVAAVLLGPDGVTAATAAFVRAPAATQVATTCVSWFDDEMVGSTTTAPHMLAVRPGCDVRRYPHLPPEAVPDRHADHLREWEAAGRRPRPLTPEALPGLLLDAEQKTIDFNVGRGVFVRMTAAEVRRAREGSADAAD